MENKEKKNYELSETEMENVTGGFPGIGIMHKQLVERSNELKNESSNSNSSIIIHKDGGVSGGW